MAKCRIGHTAEAKVLEALGVDMIDESEVLTPADPYYHVVKDDFTVPFVCGATSLGEAVRRIWEGAAMIRTKGEAGTGNVVAAMRHARLLQAEIEVVKKSKNLKKIAKIIVEVKIIHSAFINYPCSTICNIFHYFLSIEHRTNDYQIYQDKSLIYITSVSYTHLTLPTNREV
mgnify:CR=1 FL=1